MKAIKYLAILAIALFAFAGKSEAQNVQLVGGGSSALFQEIGAGMLSIPGISCIWTQGKTANITATDNRFTPAINEQGNIVVTWGPGSGSCAAPAGSYDVYSYMQLDSVVGDRCFFEVDSSNVQGCTQVLAAAEAGIAGAGLINLVPTADTALPASVQGAINGLHYNYAGTDVRPEDAKFAINRMLTPCNQVMPRQPFNQDSYYTTGLGYQTANPNLGQQVQGFGALGGGTFNVANFNITGTDPVSGNPISAYTTSTVGAQPMIIAVAPNSDSATGIAAANNINGFTLALFYQGVLARATDLVGPTAANPVNVYVREPLSGTYNTFEYSNVNGTQYHATQEYGNCNGSGQVLQNPLAYQSANAKVAASRFRVIGTGNMTKFLNSASNNTLGYFFWSAGNASGLTHVKYLTVDGADPIQSTYSNGTLPGSGGPGDPGLGVVNFAALNAGNYPIWSALRLVSASPAPAGITNLLAGLQVIDPVQHDYVTLANLKVWHSHFYINGIGLGTQEANGATINRLTPGDLCSGGIAEVGGDAGGSTVLKQANADFCADYGVNIGLVNKTQ